MSLDLRESSEAVNAAVDAKLKLLDDGYLRIYTGDRPATADDAIEKQTMLVELRWNKIAFGGAVDGEARAHAIAEAEAVETGEAAWFRALSKDQDRVFDGTAGKKTGEFNLTLASASIVQGVIVKLSEFIYRQPKQA